jgi:tetratricopeptide (TPR) repeat protein
LDGDRNETYRNSRRAAELAPRSPESYNYAFIAFRFMNRPAEAIDVLRSSNLAAGVTREWFGYWSLLTSALHAVGEYEQAIDAARRARELIPDQAERSLSIEARALAALGRPGEVGTILDELETVSGAGWLRQAYVEAVEVLRANEHDDAGHNLVDRAVQWFEHRPTSEAARRGHRFWYGKALLLAGLDDEARQLFDGLVREFPDDVEVRGARGFAAATLGDTAQAQADVEWLEDYEWLGTLGDLTSYWQLAIAGALGDHDRVAELLRGADAWWDFQVYKRESLELGPIRNHPEFQELIRPKG